MFNTDTSFLKKLTTEELEQIIRAKKLKELKLHFQNFAVLEDYFALKRKFSISQFIDSLWGAIENIEENTLDPSFVLALSPSAVGTGVITATSFVMATFSSIINYEKNKEEKIKRETNLKFINLKNACYDELAERQDKKFGVENQANPSETFQKKADTHEYELKPKHLAQIMKESVDKFLDVTTKVVTKVAPLIPKFLALAGFVGAATFIGGSVGFGISLGIGLIAGGIYAYNYFKKNKENLLLKKSEKKAERELQEKEKNYLADQNKIKLKEAIKETKNTFNKVEEKLKGQENLKSFQNDAYHTNNDSDDSATIDFDKTPEKNRQSDANTSSNQHRFFKPQDKSERETSLESQQDKSERETSLESQPILSNASHSSAL